MTDKKTAATAENTAASRGGLPKMSAARARILDLLKKGFGVQDIVKITGKKERNVRDLRAKLEKMGLWNTADIALPKSVPASQNGSGQYRVHDFTITVPVHLSSETYLRKLKQGNTWRYDGHYVQAYPKSVVIRGERKFGFEGVDHEDAMKSAHEYWERLILRFQSRYNVLLLKHDCVFMMTYETAEKDNDLAEQQVKKKEYIRVRDEEDGTTWLTLDHSDTYEADATHRITAGDDMQRVIAPVFNDYRDHVNELRKPSETWAMHDNLTEQHLRFVGETRRLEQAVARLTELHATFMEVQTSYVRSQTKILQAQLPKKERAAKVEQPDYSELRRMTL